MKQIILLWISLKGYARLSYFRFSTTHEIFLDYESEKIDLSDSSVYRDLSKPVGKLFEMEMCRAITLLLLNSSSCVLLLDLYQGL